MTIWIDADATPRPVKEVLLRVAERGRAELVFVANRLAASPPGPHVRWVAVSGGLDAADEHIAACCEAGDLVITADIPLAAKVVARGAQALDPRGELFTEANVAERLAVRDLLDQLRSTGDVVGGGPAPFDAADKREFANALDRWLTARSRGH